MQIEVKNEVRMERGESKDRRKITDRRRAEIREEKGRAGDKGRKRKAGGDESDRLEDFRLLSLGESL